MTLVLATVAAFGLTPLAKVDDPTVISLCSGTSVDLLAADIRENHALDYADLA